MEKIARCTVLVICLLLFHLGGTALAAEFRVVSSATRVEFRVTFVFGSVTGRFTSVSGSAEIEGTNLRTLHAEIPCASLDTQRGRRDEHLRSDHFFDCQQHPLIEFASTKITRTDEGLLVNGNLTIRGVTKPIGLKGNLKPLAEGGFEFFAEATLNRHDWNVSWTKSLRGVDLLIADNVTINLAGNLKPLP